VRAVPSLYPGRSAAVPSSPEPSPAPDTWTTLLDHLRRLGFTDAELLAAGLATRARTGRLIDVFRDWIVFAVHDLHGRIVGFIGRTGPRDRSGAQRYLNTADTVLYRKGEVLFGL
jgi:DNA primase